MPSGFRSARIFASRVSAFFGIQRSVQLFTLHLASQWHPIGERMAAEVFRLTGTGLG
jgi:hypothetical protein